MSFSEGEAVSGSGPDGPRPSAPRSWSFILPVNLGLLNPNKPMHYMAKHRLRQTIKNAAHIVWVSKGKPKATGRVRVDLLSMRRKALDEDNMWAAFKPVGDGLFKDAITPDDSPQYVTLGTITHTYDRHLVGLVVLVTEVE
jgi:hypothetical protein